jgi:hypothetical protein
MIETRLIGKLQSDTIEQTVKKTRTTSGQREHFRHIFADFIVGIDENCRLSDKEISKAHNSCLHVAQLPQALYTFSSNLSHFNLSDLSLT